MVRGAGRVAVGAGVRGTVRQPLALYFRPLPAVLRPEEAGEMGGGAGGGRGGLTSGRGGGDGPFRPVARQISQGIRQRTGSLGEYSARIDVYICISTVYI
jgi:hypothetical protein